MRLQSSFWLGMITGAIVSIVAFASCDEEEVESNGDKEAKKIPEPRPVNRD